MTPPPAAGPGGPTDGRPGSLPPADEPEVLLDPSSDPGGAQLGTTGAEATVDLPWPTMVRHRVQARALGSSRYRWWVLVALLSGLFALNFTFTVFVVALPTVARELHTSLSVVTWASTGPLLAFGVAAPVFGKTGDLFGHRRLYLLGLAGAMVAATLTALSPNVWVLLLARALDGAQGAATGTASMALILGMFAPEDRVKAMGWWSMVGAGGPVVGVTVGSPVIQYLGWRTLFWGQLVLLVVSAVVVALVLPAHRSSSRDVAAAGPATADMPAAGPAAPDAAAAGPGRRDQMDWLGSWSLSGAVTGTMLALSVGPVLGWASPWVVVPAGLAVASLAAFVRRERTAAHPLIPPEYFRRRNFVFPMVTRATVNFAYFGAFFLFPLMMEEVYGWGVTRVGLVSIARPLVFSLSAPVAGYAAVRVGERASAAVGAAAVVASMVLFAELGTTPAMPQVVLALCLAGLGMGVVSPSTSSAQANEVEPGRLGVMSAAQLLATQVGEVAGIQVLVTVQESLARGVGPPGALHGAALLPSFRAACWVGAAVAVAGVAAALAMRDLRRARAGAPAGRP